MKKRFSIIASFDGDRATIFGELFRDFLENGLCDIRPVSRLSAPFIYEPFFVDGYQEHPWEIIFGSPAIYPTEGKKTIYITRWETGARREIDCVSRAQKLFVPSAWDLQQFWNAGVRVDADVIPYGFPDQVILHDRYEVPRSDFVVGAVFDDSWQTVLSSFHGAFPDKSGKLLFLGGTEMKKIVIDPRVTFLPEPVHGFERDDFYKRLSVFICLGNPHGLEAIEAMAAGVPVIADGYGTKTEAINDSGFVIQRASIEKLYPAIRRLSFDRKVLEDRARRCRRAVWSWSEIRDRLATRLSACGVI